MFDLILPWLFPRDFLSLRENASYLHYDGNDLDQQAFYAWKNSYLAMQDFDIRAHLYEIVAPRLVIAADQDRLAHVEDAMIMAKYLPNSKMKVIENPDILLIMKRLIAFIKMSLNLLIWIRLFSRLRAKCNTLTMEEQILVHPKANCFITLVTAPY